VSGFAQAAVDSRRPDPTTKGWERLFARFLDEGMASTVARRTGPPALPQPWGDPGSIVVSGRGLGLPGQNRHVFDDSNVERILRGDSFIDTVPSSSHPHVGEEMWIDLVKREVCEPSLDPISVGRRGYSLAGRRGALISLANED